MARSKTCRIVAPIAAGEAVVASNKGRIAAHLKRHYGDALAVEMEGRGFLEAAHIESGCRAVVVRGISDLLRGKAKAGWQPRAADAAAAFSSRCYRAKIATTRFAIMQRMSRSDRHSQL
jgi:nucleoside phosphorylase